MRVLILTCNAGGGHTAAAKALKETFDKEGIYCEIADSLAFFSQKVSNFISKWHVRLYKNAPMLFGYGYKKAEKIYGKHKRSMLYETICKGAKKLRDKAVSDNIDTVICTHPFSAMTLTRAMKKYHLKLDKTYFVATDYTCSPGVGTSDLDYYIIPHKDTINDFVSQGVRPERIVVHGIPVSPRVHMALSKEESKKKLSLPTDKKLILLMCGSMGCGPLKFIARELSSALKEDEQLVVICGTNHRLYKKLEELDIPGRVRILGFSNNVPLYMNSADLMLTKPGGLSTTEAAENHLPMILIDAVSGCETHNMRFWTESGMAKTREKTSELCTLVRELMDNPKDLDDMRETLTENFPENSSERIFKFIKQNSASK